MSFHMDQDQLSRRSVVLAGEESFRPRRSIESARRTGAMLGGLSATGVQLLGMGGHTLVSATEKDPVRYRFSLAKDPDTAFSSPWRSSMNPVQRWLSPRRELRLRQIAKNMGIPMRHIGLVNTGFLSHNAAAGRGDFGRKGYVFANFSRGVPEWVLAHELGHLKTLTSKRPYGRDLIYGLPTDMPASWLGGKAIRMSTPERRYAAVAAATLMAANRLPSEFSADYHAIRGLGGGLKTKDARRVLASYVAKRTPAALTYIASAATPLAIFAGGRMRGARAARRLNQQMNTAATIPSSPRNADAGR